MQGFFCKKIEFIHSVLNRFTPVNIKKRSGFSVAPFFIREVCDYSMSSPLSAASAASRAAWMAAYSSWL